MDSLAYHFIALTISGLFLKCLLKNYALLTIPTVLLLKRFLESISVTYSLLNVFSLEPTVLQFHH